MRKAKRSQRSNRFNLYGGFFLGIGLFVGFMAIVFASPSTLPQTANNAPTKRFVGQTLSVIPRTTSTATLQSPDAILADYTVTPSTVLPIASLDSRVIVQAKNTIPVRAGAGEEYAKLGTIRSGGKIEVSGQDASGTWLYFLYYEKPAWLNGALVDHVSGDLASLAVLESATITPVPPTRVKPTRPPATELPEPTEPYYTPIQQLSCGTCSQMTSCDQAYACLRAGHTELDRNKNGVPCDDMCLK